MRTGVVVRMMVTMPVRMIVTMPMRVGMTESCETNDIDYEPKDANYEQFIESAKLGAFS